MNKGKKSLLKLTESSSSAIEEPDRFQKIINDVCRQHPPLLPNASRQEQNRYRNTIIDGIINHPSMGEAGQIDLRNQTWEHNHLELIGAMNRMMTDNNSMPSVNELALETGLTRMTVYKHLDDLTKSASYQTQIKQFQMMAGQVLVQLYNLANMGDVRAAKVYLDAIGGKLGTNLSKAGEQELDKANYIQINNNLKIDQITFATLPVEVQEKITNLVLTGLQATNSSSHQFNDEVKRD